MASPDPIERACDAAVASLREHLNDEIAAVNAALGLTGHPDALPAVDPDRICYGLGENPLVAYPTIEVAAPDWTLSHASINTWEWDLTMTLVVAAWLQDVDYERLSRNSTRMRRALLAVLAAPDACGPFVLTDARGAIRTADPETGAREEFVSGSVIIATLAGVEARP